VSVNEVTLLVESTSRLAVILLRACDVY
jgi:hypothetical protein